MPDVKKTDSSQLCMSSLCSGSAWEMDKEILKESIHEGMQNASSLSTTFILQNYQDVSCKH